MSDSAHTVQHQPEENRFVILIDTHVARAEYTLADDDVITFTHTIVPKALQGQGLGIKLVKAGLRYAREHHLKVVPQCTMFAGYMRKHPETQELLADEGRRLVA